MRLRLRRNIGSKPFVEIDMERRKYPRLTTASPMEYHLPVKGLGIVWALKGILKDISLGGFYFTCENRLWMDLGDILDFNIDVAPLKPDSQDLNYLSVQGMVVRIEYLGLGADPCGVGVKFLQPLDVSFGAEQS